MTFFPSHKYHDDSEEEAKNVSGSLAAPILDGCRADVGDGVGQVYCCPGRFCGEVAALPHIPRKQSVRLNEFLLLKPLVREVLPVNTTCTRTKKRKEVKYTHVRMH